MHLTAFANCQQFFEVYASGFVPGATQVVDIGAQDVNGSLRGCCPSGFTYTGVDFVSGKGVDVVLEDPYVLPFPTASVDIVLSSSCFEHSELFWVLFLEIMRILKPGGLFYLNVPSNGPFHRYPVDCWRFYPDSGNALVSWAKRNGMNPLLLESYTSVQVEDLWNDFVAVFIRDETQATRFPGRILDIKQDVLNGLRSGSQEFVGFNLLPEDQKKLMFIKAITENKANLI